MTAPNENKEHQKSKKDEEFLANLAKMAESDRGGMAILKRNAGNTIAESRGAMKTFYSLLPYGISDSPYEEIYFLIATLYGHNKYRFTGDFGQTMKLVRESSNSESIDQRVSTLLDSEFNIVDGIKPGGGELAYRLRQCVKLASGHEIGVDWYRLLQDLKYWGYPEKRVQKRWARSYFGYGKPVESETKESKEEAKA
ncbi:type I-E CRISPR-associated protein Cse2/CasB [Methanocella arvoryzae]|uniref:Type I-E CRISPR-associated protein Cse2/CasB n=1 Tax=Methanocella arvoryzae (strain DSM 22066 / NBRC 105507 / MRE50) TaxID=351160 RepID=Q0W586_METAR|nr:type I-E CRISPR-associated protein Cse2/CasB [Methanocella arvoryzae]CAJ36457.1 conserved hypothetical protein [Methanocella arvoryzae MRE50]